MTLAAVALGPGPVLSEDEREGLRQAAQLEEAYRELRWFVVDAFKVLEQGRRFVPTWHIGVVCDDLQAWTRPLWDPDSPDPDPRDRVCVLCVPPRSLKTVIKICLKAWLWVRQPWLSFHGFGADEDLEEDSNRRLMELVTSPWYQHLIRYAHIRNGGSADDYLPWGIDPKQHEKENFLNTAGGGSMAYGMDSKVIGRGADLQSTDDPYDVKEATLGSPDQIAARMKRRVTDFRTRLNSRYRNLKRFLRLVIQQRLDPGDLAGVLIRRGARAIVFPMEFDPEFPKDHGGVHSRDPRTKPGELLMPDVVSQPEWDAMKEDAANSVEGLRMLDAQYNQRTRPREGGLFREDQFARRFKGDPMKQEVDEVIIFVDCSFKDAKTSSHVVFQAWGRVGRVRYKLLDQVRARMDFVKTCRTLVDFQAKLAAAYPGKMRRVVVEDKANGTATINLLQDEIPGIQPFNPETKSKYERAQIGTLPALEAGQVEFPEDQWAPWMPGYVLRHVEFDGSERQSNDEIDTSSMAFLYMAKRAESPLDRLKRRIPSTLVR